MNQSGPSSEHTLWLVEGLFYSMRKGYFDKEVSVTDLKGTAKKKEQKACPMCCCSSWP